MNAKNLSNEDRAVNTKKRKISNTERLQGNRKSCIPKPYFTSIFSNNPESFDLGLESCVDGSSCEPLNLLVGRKFRSQKLHPNLLRYLEDSLHITKATEIQSYSIPALSRNQNSDFVIQARTGSGKTLSFLIPIVDAILKGSVELHENSKALDRSLGALCIIISPTRELALQLFSVVNGFLKCFGTSKADVLENRHKVIRWVVACLLTSGTSRKGEKAILRKGVQILVSTPGRLLDHLKNTKSFNSRELRWIILDEADILLELGFQETLIDIMKILKEKSMISNKTGTKYFPNRIVKAMCSATINRTESLSREILEDPIMITTEGVFVRGNMASSPSAHLGNSISETVDQHFILVPTKQRIVCLIGLLKRIFRINSSPQQQKIIVFLITCDSVDHIFNLLANAKLLPDVKYEPPEEELFSESHIIDNTEVLKLHGKLPALSREKVFKRFSDKSKKSILLTTDLAGRGLDIPEVIAIVQYDLPLSSKDYVHRVGRTARMGKSGQAWTFLLDSEREYINMIQKELGESSKITQLEPKRLLAEFALGENKKSCETLAMDVQMCLERYTLSSTETLEIAQNAFMSYIRAYASHKDRKIFSVKNLHFGHVAKSFALPCAPSDLAGALSKYKKNNKKQEQTPCNYRTLNKTLVSNTSEFSAGIS